MPLLTEGPPRKTLNSTRNALEEADDEVDSYVMETIKKRKSPEKKSSPQKKAREIFSQQGDYGDVQYSSKHSRELSAKDQAAQSNFYGEVASSPPDSPTRPFQIAVHHDPSLTLPLVSDYGNGKGSKDDDDLNDDDILNDDSVEENEDLGRKSSIGADQVGIREAVRLLIPLGYGGKWVLAFALLAALLSIILPLLYYLFRELPLALTALARIAESVGSGAGAVGHFISSFAGLVTTVTAERPRASGAVMFGVVAIKCCVGPSLARGLWVTFQRLRARLKVVGPRAISGRPIKYLESASSTHRRAGCGGAPTLLLLHDAFGSKDDLAALVGAMGGGIHCVVVDLAGHGDHHTGPGRGEGDHSLRRPDDYRVEQQAAWLANFRVDVLGPSRIHHVLGVGLGASVAVEYAKMPAVSPFVKSLTLASPYGVMGPCAFDGDAFNDFRSGEPRSFHSATASSVRREKIASSTRHPQVSAADAPDIDIADDGTIGGAAAWEAAGALRVKEAQFTDRHETAEAGDNVSPPPQTPTSLIAISDFAAMFAIPTELAHRMASSVVEHPRLRGKNGPLGGGKRSQRSVLRAKLCVNPIWMPALVDLSLAAEWARDLSPQGSDSSHVHGKLRSGPLHWVSILARDLARGISGAISGRSATVGHVGYSGGGPGGRARAITAAEIVRVAANSLTRHAIEQEAFGIPILIAFGTEDGLAFHCKATAASRDEVDHPRAVLAELAERNQDLDTLVLNDAGHDLFREQTAMPVLARKAAAWVQKHHDEYLLNIRRGATYFS